MSIKRLEYYYKKATQHLLLGARTTGEKLAHHKYLFVKLPGGKKLHPFVRRYKFAFGVALAIIICLILTGFSVLLYVVTGTAKLDLSRPGYEGVRQKVVKSPPSQHGFSASGTLDEKTIDIYLENYKKQSQIISKYDNFNPRILDDVSLGFSTVQPESSETTAQ